MNPPQPLTIKEEAKQIVKGPWVVSYMLTITELIFIFKDHNMIILCFIKMERYFVRFRVKNETYLQKHTHMKVAQMSIREVEVTRR